MVQRQLLKYTYSNGSQRVVVMFLACELHDVQQQHVHQSPY